MKEHTAFISGNMPWFRYMSTTLPRCCIWNSLWQHIAHPVLSKYQVSMFDGPQIISRFPKAFIKIPDPKYPPKTTQAPKKSPSGHYRNLAISTNLDHPGFQGSSFHISITGWHQVSLVPPPSLWPTCTAEPAGNISWRTPLPGNEQPVRPWKNAWEMTFPIGIPYLLRGYECVSFRQGFFEN